MHWSWNHASDEVWRRLDPKCERSRTTSGSSCRRFREIRSSTCGPIPSFGKTWIICSKPGGERRMGTNPHATAAFCSAICGENGHDAVGMSAVERTSEKNDVRPQEFLSALLGYISLESVRGIRDGQHRALRFCDYVIRHSARKVGSYSSSDFRRCVSAPLRSCRCFGQMRIEQYVPSFLQTVAPRDQRRRQTRGL